MCLLTIASTTAVNVLSTPISFWTIEKLGRRTLLIYGAVGMLICEFIVAIVGTAAKEGSSAAGYCLIIFTCFYIFFFASTWGPAAWVVIGEIFPLPIRAKGVALSTASNWLWNFVIGYITPYMVDADEGNLKSKVFFVWGATCTLCVVFAWGACPGDPAACRSSRSIACLKRRRRETVLSGSLTRHSPMKSPRTM